MKISELIGALHELQLAHGDLEVRGERMTHYYPVECTSAEFHMDGSDERNDYSFAVLELGKASTPAGCHNLQKVWER